MPSFNFKWKINNFESDSFENCYYNFVNSHLHSPHQIPSIKDISLSIFGKKIILTKINFDKKFITFLNRKNKLISQKLIKLNYINE